MKKITVLDLLAALFLGVMGWLRSTAVTAQRISVPTGVGITVSTIESGFSRPVDIANAGDDRLFIVEQDGVIRIIDEDGNKIDEPFLDINEEVDSETHSERGLLGLTFHPDYPNTPYFYVNYTVVSGSGDTIIERYMVSSDPNIADESSATEILRIDQPDPNHNAGDLNFGPQDGYLYIAMGDGGSGNDSGSGHNPAIGNAQDMTQLLGKVVRIDVDGESGLAPDCGTIDGGGTPPYTIPTDNPFTADSDGICNEIWASGLRNPWRASFDHDTGDYYIGDVGQGAFEEVNFQPVSSMGGENYGWRCYEGNNFTNIDSMAECDDSYVFPFDDYPRDNASNDDDEGQAVTGGYVYRGNDFPALDGIYIYADYISGNFWLAQNSGGWNITILGEIGVNNPSTFGEGCDGELYVASLSGTIYQIQSSGGVKPEGDPLDEFVYLPLVMNNASAGLTCSG